MKKGAASPPLPPPPPPPYTTHSCLIPLVGNFGVFVAAEGWVSVQK